MTCREFEKNLNDWQGDDGPLARALTPHAGSCAECRQKLELHAEVMAGLSRLREATAGLEPSAGVEQELRRAFRREASSLPSTAAATSWSWQRWGAVAASIVLVLLAGIQLGTRLNAPAEPELAQVENQTPEATGETQIAVGSDFIQIGGCLDPECLGNSQLMRVRIPRSSLLHFGLPMNSELAENEVLADVLVAEDGSAQAIRFVNY